MNAHVQNVAPTQTLGRLYNEANSQRYSSVMSQVLLLLSPNCYLTYFFTVPNGVKIDNWITLTFFGLRFLIWSQVTPLVLSDEQPDIAVKSENKIEDHSEDWFG